MNINGHILQHENKLYKQQAISVLQDDLLHIERLEVFLINVDEGHLNFFLIFHQNYTWKIYTHFTTKKINAKKKTPWNNTNFTIDTIK